MYKLAIVIPDAYFDCHANLKLVLDSLKSKTEIQIIFVDRNIIQTRAGRLNTGFKLAKADWVLFHHPRSWLDLEDYLDIVENLPNAACWIGFRHTFDIDHYFLKFTSWYSNFVRLKRGIVYLDHCILFHRSFLHVPIPEIAIFEDTELSKIFLKTSRPILSNKLVKTSAVRFVKNGYLKQGLLNQFLKLAYHLKLSNNFINSIYEKGLGLNNKK